MFFRPCRPPAGRATHLDHANRLRAGATLKVLPFGPAHDVAGAHEAAKDDTLVYIKPSVGAAGGGPSVAP